MYLLGFDIGGTKCAVVTAQWDGNRITLRNKEKMPTDLSISPEEMIDRLIWAADRILDQRPDAIGISCGGPLDSEHGVVLGPPNLPGWDHVEISAQISRHYGVPATLQNDANAGAVAEWKFGAGKGCQNMVFMTFGTGLGAGLILNGSLYCGTNDNAGEAGHFRLAPRGPVGYGKAGSFEGFCSGGGIAQLGYQKALEQMKKGTCPAYFKEGYTLADVSAKTIADAARAGDKTALAVYRTSGTYLGKGLSLIIDLLNPEVIAIGGVFSRARDLLWPYASRVIDREALAPSKSCVKVVCAELGEHIGDYAAIAAAISRGE